MFQSSMPLLEKVKDTVHFYGQWVLCVLGWGTGSSLPSDSVSWWPVLREGTHRSPQAESEADVYTEG